MKPLHANCLIECYNRLTQPAFERVILSGWRETGISKALSEESKYFLKLMDPFREVDPFTVVSQEDFVHEVVVGASMQSKNKIPIPTHPMKN